MGDRIGTGRNIEKEPLRAISDNKLWRTMIGHGLKECRQIEKEDVKLDNYPY